MMGKPQLFKKIVVYVMTNECSAIQVDEQSLNEMRHACDMALCITLLGETHRTASCLLKGVTFLNSDMSLNA